MTDDNDDVLNDIGIDELAQPMKASGATMDRERFEQWMDQAPALDESMPRLMASRPIRYHGEAVEVPPAEPSKHKH